MIFLNLYSGELFIRLTQEEAREWGKKNMKQSAFSAEFGK